MLHLADLPMYFGNNPKYPDWLSIICIQHGVASNVAKQLYLSSTGICNLISPLIIIFDSMEIMQ